MDGDARRPSRRRGGDIRRRHFEKWCAPLAAAGRRPHRHRQHRRGCCPGGTSGKSSLGEGEGRTGGRRLQISADPPSRRPTSQRHDVNHDVDVGRSGWSTSSVQGQLGRVEAAKDTMSRSPVRSGSRGVGGERQVR